jgi:hypothetical protein
MRTEPSEIAHTAARLVVEEGLEYGAAKHQAIKQLGLPNRTALPTNEELEEAVAEYIALFCAESQPVELLALRQLALVWMTRLAAFRPYLGGAVWHGTATRHSDIFIQLFCDDEKSAEIALIDQGVRYQPGTLKGLHGKTVPVLSIQSRCEALNEMIGIHLTVYDLDDVRGALLADSKKRPPRGDLAAVRRLLHDSP